MVEHGNQSGSTGSPVSRRSFLGGTTAAGLAGMMGGAVAQESEKRETKHDNEENQERDPPSTPPGLRSNQQLGPFGLVTNAATRGAVYEAQNPQAVYVDSEETTFIVYRGPDADPYATWYDHETKTFNSPTQIGTNPLDDTDNHGVPSLTIDDDGTLHVFYGAHGDRGFQYAQSKEPYDPTEWNNKGELTSVPGGTYPSPLTYNNDIYALYRAGGRHASSYPAHEFATIIRSTDGGDTWTDIGPILDTSGHPNGSADAYVFDFDEHDDKLHMSWVVAHGDPHGTPRAHTFHGYYDPSDGHVYGLDGTDFGSTITWEEMSGSVIQAFKGQNTNYAKHAFKGETVHVSFTYYNPEVERVEWRLATWDGNGWNVEQIDNALTKGLFNNGQIRINDSGDLEAHVIAGGGELASAPDALSGGTRGGNYEIYTKRDGEWSRRLVAPATTSTELARLTIVRNGLDELAALFAELTYNRVTPNVRLFAQGNVGQNITIQEASTRVGYVPPVNLTKADGTNEGELLLHDGSDGDNTNAYGPAVWTGEEWLSVVNGETIE